ncbi:calcium-binding tyrosine phosphorylation-regulated protein-like isoform X4 [Stegodyphus dumicola]|uniref:calcium-binding tyrosine phosphorylation-regulated protein-like isoform X4 n=1 Tax=Stegodyphus dumicola TaxID=202533 RepID=UPI0015AF373B|nr:calcium-binding tyrosine phosphorylation-regulated protein-like isoform X4 [Stegodyphus dumicola]
MTMSVTRPRPVVPEELPKLLHSISYAVIKNNPNDIISFAANHFQQLYDEREQQKKVAAEEKVEQNHDNRESNVCDE